MSSDLTPHTPRDFRHPLLMRVSEQLRQLLPPEVRHLVVALSGGADSVALLHALMTLRGRYAFALSALHLNHNLRGEESLRDQGFVQHLCADWGIPLVCHSLPIATMGKERRISVETAGREARYELLAQACRTVALQCGAPCLAATAHTLSDQAETVLLNLMRGAGVEGLAGMPPTRPGVIRPLLTCSRADVEDYCRYNSLCYVTDSTNLEPVYARNWVRLELLPLMESRNPGLLRTLGRQADLLREEAALLSDWADAALLILDQRDGGLTLDRTLLRAQPPALGRRALRQQVARSFGLSLSAVQSQQLMQLCLRGKNGIMWSLPGDLVAQAVYNTLVLRRATPTSDTRSSDPLPHPLQQGCNRLPWFGGLTLLSGPFSELCQQTKKYFSPVYIHLLKYDIIKGMPTVRTRRQGDAYAPDGRRRRTLKRLAIDAKIPAHLRATLPVVTAPTGELLSAFPFGPASDYALSPRDPPGDNPPAIALLYSPLLPLPGMDPPPTE